MQFCPRKLFARSMRTRCVEIYMNFSKCARIFANVANPLNFIPTKARLDFVRTNRRHTRGMKYILIYPCNCNWPLSHIHRVFLLSNFLRIFLRCTTKGYSSLASFYQICNGFSSVTLYFIFRLRIVFRSFNSQRFYNYRVAFT